jgi:hypothetical protein
MIKQTMTNFIDSSGPHFSPQLLLSMRQHRLGVQDKARRAARGGAAQRGLRPQEAR